MRGKKYNFRHHSKCSDDDKEKEEEMLQIIEDSQKHLDQETIALKNTKQPANLNED
jgi:hypothetical protein